MRIKYRSQAYWQTYVAFTCFLTFVVTPVTIQVLGDQAKNRRKIMIPHTEDLRMIVLKKRLAARNLLLDETESESADEKNEEVKDEEA